MSCLDVSLGRRHLLSAGAGGFLLLAFGALLPAGCTRYPKPKPALRFFTAKEYAIVNLLAARLLGGPAVAGAVDVGAAVDRLVAEWDGEVRTQLRVALRIIEHGTALFELQRKRFTRLSVDEQHQYLAGWATSTLGARRMVFRGLKALVAVGLYETEWDGLDYDGPWLGRVDASPRLQPEPAVDARQLQRWRA